MTRRNDQTDNARRILVDRVTGGEPLPANVLHVPPRMPDAPVRIDRRPRVSDDPCDVAAVRDLWEREIDTQYDAALDAVRSGQHVYLEHRHALQQRRERAVAELREILADEHSVGEAGRARAARTLCAGACGPGRRRRG